MSLLFHIFFIQRYARMLEESAPSRAHFAWLLAYAATTLLCLAPLLSVMFLGSTLSSTLVYIWARRHPDVQLSFLGLFVFTAPWLPWVMLGLSVVLHSQWPKDELCGIIVGHGKITTLLHTPSDVMPRVLTLPPSLVLLQRHLPLDSQRITPSRPPELVEETFRRQTLQ